MFFMYNRGFNLQLQLNNRNRGFPLNAKKVTITVLPVAGLGTRFLPRKLEKYEVLKTEIDALRLQVGQCESKDHAAESTLE